MNKLKKIYFRMNIKYPSLGMLIKRLYKYKILFNKTDKKVRGKSNKIKSSYTILNNVVFDIRGDNNTIEIRDGSVLNNFTFYIRGDNHKVIIEKNCIFSRAGMIWFEHNSGYLEIGQNTTMEDVHIAVTESNSKIIIGQDCMFANDIDIRTGDSHSIFDKDSGKRINYAEDVIIDDHVWLASHCRILKGSHIKKDSIVGTNSVVTKKFSEGSVVIAGSPARVVKKNITWDRENIEKK